VGTRSGSGRILVEVVEIRAGDVQIGDIVNKAGRQRDGWIEVAALERLPDGRVNIADESYQQSFTSHALDLVWLQVARPLLGNSHIAVPGDRERPLSI
jgi:hypothetical protein